MRRNEQRWLVRAAAPVLGGLISYVTVFAGTTLGFDEKIEKLAHQQNISLDQANHILRENQKTAAGLAGLFGAVAGLGAGLILTLRPVHHRWASALEKRNLLNDQPEPD